VNGEDAKRQTPLTCMVVVHRSDRFSIIVSSQRWRASRRALITHPSNTFTNTTCGCRDMS
jgi:hypothetical protein